MLTVTAVLSAVFGIFWGVIALRAVRSGSLLPILPRTDRREVLPRVSILVAVRNEVDRILDESLLHMLNQDYPDFEVIAVDDHSTDDSLERMVQISLEHSKLKVFSASEGETGKRMALARAGRHASGEWLLFTDADALLEPEAIVRSLVYATDHGLDSISLVPRTLATGFWEQVTIASASWITFLLPSMATCNSDEKPVGMAAAGPFILMRKDAYDKMGGYEQIAQNVLVDIFLARKCRLSGYRYRYLHSDGVVRTRMYRSLREIWNGFTKNAYAAVGHPLWAFLIVTTYLCVCMVPVLLPCLVSLSSIHSSAIIGVALVPALLMYVSQSYAAKWMGTMPALVPLMASPLGAMLWCGIMIRSLGSKKIVSWKGRAVRM